ncbi:MAG: beta-lactamase family protein [Phycisphaerales bacterium]|nr:MAG: beta-lactamase family protein [Phycisphaerales bacterium]
MKTPPLLVGLVFVSSGLGTVATSLGFDPNHDALSRQVDEFFARWDKPDTPGAAVVITRSGSVLYRRCYGLANLEHRVPITPKTVFELASTSKPFTATAVLLLEQAGKLTLDDPIRSYIPELPDFADAVTLRHLLHHTSGLWDYWTIMTYYAGFTQYDYFRLGDVLRLLERQPELLFTPGSQWKYCNANYALLAEVVARVTGESFSSWTKKHIFDPLGMEDSFFQHNCRRMVPNLASAYHQENGAYFRGRQYGVDFAGPAHMFATIDDMALWLDNFRTRKVGDTKVIEKMCQKNRLNDGSEHFYGLGVGILARHGETVIHHSGQSGNFVTTMLYCPRKELGISILANTRTVKAEKLGFEILGLCLGKKATREEKPEQPEPKPFVTASRDKMNKYAGGYVIEESGVHVGILAEATRLVGLVDGLGMDSFFPTSDSHFANGARNVRITFVPNDEGRICAAAIDVKGQILRADRIAIKKPTPDELREDYAGPYFCDAFGTVYELVETEGRLVVRHRRYGDRELVQTDRDEFMGEVGFLRFERNKQGAVLGFAMLDETFSFRPIYFKKVGDGGREGRRAPG